MIQESNKGVSLYLSLVILSIIMAVLIGVFTIALSQIRIVYSIGNSVIAFYAADSGMEELLYRVFRLGYVPVVSECPIAGNFINASYEVCVSDSDPNQVFSSGTHTNSGTVRKLEINF